MQVKGRFINYILTVNTNTTLFSFQYVVTEVIICMYVQYRQGLATSKLCVKKEERNSLNYRPNVSNTLERGQYPVLVSFILKLLM